jgi:hypothetical protein
LAWVRALEAPGTQTLVGLSDGGIQLACARGGLHGLNLFATSRTASASGRHELTLAAA